MNETSWTDNDLSCSNAFTTTMLEGTDNMLLLSCGMPPLQSVTIWKPSTWFMVPGEKKAWSQLQVLENISFMPLVSTRV